LLRGVAPGGQPEDLKTPIPKTTPYARKTFVGTKEKRVKMAAALLKARVTSQRISLEDVEKHALDTHEICSALAKEPMAALVKDAPPHTSAREQSR
jgi:hypothetical protein